MAQMMLDDLVTYIEHRKLRFAGCTMGLQQLAQLLKIPEELFHAAIVDDPVVWPIAAYLKMSATELIAAAEAFVTEPEPEPEPEPEAVAAPSGRAASEAEIEISVDDVDGDGESDEGAEDDEEPASSDV